MTVQTERKYYFYYPLHHNKYTYEYARDIAMWVATREKDPSGCFIVQKGNRNTYSWTMHPTAPAYKNEWHIFAHIAIGGIMTVVHSQEQKGE